MVYAIINFVLLTLFLAFYISYRFSVEQGREYKETVKDLTLSIIFGSAYISYIFFLIYTFVTEVILKE